MKQNIRLTLSRLNPVAVLMLLRNVISKMTGNLYFTTPKVDLTAMALLGDKLEASIDLATAGSKQAKLDRDELVTLAKADLNAQADYVRSICSGNAAMLNSSGFELSKLPEPVGVPTAPPNVTARPTGKIGELEVRCDRSKGAIGYGVYMSTTDPAENGSWTLLAYTGRVRYLATGLESYKAYWFCVIATGAAGDSAKSDPALGRAA